MIGLYGSRAASGDWTVQVLRDMVHASPWASELGASPSASSEAELRELAGRQAAMHRRMHPEGAIGGNLWMARITRDAVKLHDAGEIVEERTDAPTGPEITNLAVTRWAGWAA